VLPLIQWTTVRLVVSENDGRRHDSEMEPQGRGSVSPLRTRRRNRTLALRSARLFRAESARPVTITTADSSDRIAINEAPTALDQFRGTPYVQADLRVSRPITLGERWALTPFAEFFNLFNRNNPGNNYVTNIAALPVPSDHTQTGDITDICSNSDCTATQPIRSPSQLRVPGGALGSC
jgi:hypothetical protein